jgi:dTDP-glucose 4,6-dehydratase
MNWQGKTVVVTGGGGFIPSHLCERLVELGANVRPLLRYNSSGRWGWLDTSPLRDEMDVRLGDLCDRDSVRDTVKGADVVFHLGALIAIPYSYLAPGSYVATNVEGTLNVLQAVRDEGVSRMVHTSTSEVYGTARYVPIDEQHPLQGQSPYSASKIAADKLVESFHLSFEVPVSTARPFNTYGPRQSARAVIPTVISQALKGGEVRLGALSPTRDLNFVSDTVDGFLAVAASDKSIGRTINLGNGQEISVGDLAAMIIDIIGSDSEIVSEEARLRPVASEVERLLADNSLAAELLDWAPKVSLREGLEKTVDWLREWQHLYRSDRYVV